MRSISLLYTPPENPITGGRHQLEISFESKTENFSKKVFFANWDPLDVHRFDRGSWILDVFYGTYNKFIVL
jgi:hypothetical protein